MGQTLGRGAGGYGAGLPRPCSCSPLALVALTVCGWDSWPVGAGGPPTTHTPCVGVGASLGSLSAPPVLLAAVPGQPHACRMVFRGTRRAVCPAAAVLWLKAGSARVKGRSEGV